jgi:hypothetical protein
MEQRICTRPKETVVLPGVFMRVKIMNGLSRGSDGR